MRTLSNYENKLKEIVYKVFLDNYNRDKSSIFQLESHTDFSLQPSQKYPTTWHLASARANDT